LLVQFDGVPGDDVGLQVVEDERLVGMELTGRAKRIVL
jgi:hypothetical protein